MIKNTFCSYCGSEFKVEVYPRTCDGCNNITYVNPLPVAALIVPMGDGILTVRRLNAPQIGWRCLPGGYVDWGETWQEACARELWEETGFQVNAQDIELHDVFSAHDNTILTFGKLTYTLPEAELENFIASTETHDAKIIKDWCELAFPAHTYANYIWFMEKERVISREQKLSIRKKFESLKEYPK